jgi:hypothetical protein
MPKVKHVVLMKVRPDTPTTQTGKIFRDLASLVGQVPGLLDFSGGAYSTTEGLNQGFTHGFVMTFADEASRDGYLPHPLHEFVKSQIVAVLDGGLAGVIAFDWLMQA